MRSRSRAARIAAFCFAMTLSGLAAAAAELPNPGKTVAAFHEALGSGNRQLVLELLDPEVTIFESGGAELSREEYANHHLGADMEFAAGTSREAIDRQSERAGDIAWVLTRSVTKGSFRGRAIDIAGVETVLLRKGEAGWRILHVHWSSRDKK